MCVVQLKYFLMFVCFSSIDRLTMNHLLFHWPKERGVVIRQQITVYWISYMHTTPMGTTQLQSTAEEIQLKVLVTLFTNTLTPTIPTSDSHCACLMKTPYTTMPCQTTNLTILWAVRIPDYLPQNQSLFPFSVVFYRNSSFIVEVKNLVLPLVLVLHHHLVQNHRLATLNLFAPREEMEAQSQQGEVSVAVVAA